MDIKPTKEKKKKKVTKKREIEISRRRSSVLRNPSDDDTEGLLAPTQQNLLTHSAPGSRRGSVSEEPLKEEVESEGENENRSDVLWDKTLPVAVIENAWKRKSRMSNVRRRSSGTSELDVKSTLDRLRMEKTVNIFKMKNEDDKKKFFWDSEKSADLSEPEP